MDMDHDPELGRTSTIKWWGLIPPLVFMTLIAFAYMDGWFMDRDAINTRQSHQFITSHQSALRMLFVQYQASNLSERQRRGVYQQMRFEADLIPNNVPDDIRAALDRGPNNLPDQGSR